MTCGETYHELHRPQFHFTPKKDWMNDPNGLVFYKGEYHLYFQYTPDSVRHGPNTWGHAVSTDLVHWEQIEHAIEPDEYGWIWSGSAIVDWNNTAGLRKGDEDTIVAVYTIGGFGDPPNPCVQSISYSNDRGRTFTMYEGNPVLGHIRAANRDPKVIWHEPTQKWIMALYLDDNDYTFYGSKDLKEWDHLCDLAVPGTSECPDFFPLAVDGDPENIKWILWGAAGVYSIGSFDGTAFVPEEESIKSEFGANGYAAQTWSDMPADDGRCIQTSWMAGGQYPSMPFNQQMSFPVELTLRTFPEGVRMCRLPVREIEVLRDKTHAWQDHTLKAGENIIPDTKHDLFDIEAEIELGDAAAFGVIVRGLDLRYHVGENRLSYRGKDIPAEPVDGRITLRLLVDRTSLEIFVGAGKVSASYCYLPDAWNAPLEFYAAGGSVKLISLAVHELQSAWS